MCIPVCFLLAFTALGALLIGLSLRNVRRGSASRRWPRTTGCVTRSFVLVGKPDGEGQTYTPNVEYEYRVEGVKYLGATMQYGQMGFSYRGWAERAIAGYPPGASVAVFYDPRRPAVAVLVPGTSRWNLILVAVGVVFLAAALRIWQLWPR